METILTGLGITLIIAFAVPLAVLRAGIRQQERTRSLTSRPPGLSAALARRVFGLHADLPGTAGRLASQSRRAGDESSFVPDKNGSAI